MDLLLVILLMLLLSAFFSGSEIAFVVANRLRVEVQARRGGLIALLVRRFLQDPTMLLTTTLVGNNIALVVYSTLMAFYLDPLLSGFFIDVVGLNEMQAGIPVLSTGGEVAVLGTQTVVASLVVLVFGEILPKSLVREVANEAVFVLALPLRLTYFLLLPMIKLAAWSSTLLIKLFQTDADTFSQLMRRDFEVIIQEGKESGELDLDEDESALLSNVFAMSTIRVKESMTPRTDIVAVERNTPVEDLRSRFMETGHSKLPVYDENIDHIVGVAFAYDLFQQPASLEEMMRRAHFVPESKRSKDLLREFLASNTSIAVVIDEYGGTAGLVTREDLLEELFGDIQDEFDTETEILRRSGENAYIASGRVRLDELEDRFDVELPEGDYETLAGYIVDTLGSIPSPHEEFSQHGYRFIVLKATTTRVDLVRIVRETPALGT